MTPLADEELEGRGICSGGTTGGNSGGLSRVARAGVVETGVNRESPADTPLLDLPKLLAPGFSINTAGVSYIEPSLFVGLVFGVATWGVIGPSGDGERSPKR